MNLALWLRQKAACLSLCRQRSGTDQTVGRGRGQKETWDINGGLPRLAAAINGFTTVRLICGLSPLFRVGGVLIPTRSFGDFLLKSEMDKPAWKQVISVVPQIVSHRLNSSWDFVVVASDGVWDAVTNRDLVALVRDRLNDDDGKKKKVGDIILCLQSARARFNVEQFNLGKAPLPPLP